MSFSSVILPIVNFVMAASLHRVRLRRIRSARQRSSSTLVQKPSTWRDCGSASPSAIPTPSRRLRRIETNVDYGTATAPQHAASYALDNRTDLVPPTVREYQQG